MMTSVTKKIPTTPRAAARRLSDVDRRLDTALFKAIADPTRAKLLACLVKCSRPCSVTEVAECCAVDFSVVARHLAVLARAGVLHMVKKSRTVWYTARSRELAETLRGLAAAIDEWSSDQSGCCSDVADGPCCAPNGPNRKLRKPTHSLVSRRPSP